ncbi:hypothetical protein ANN_03148 [Periplaneta americana]|uniref:Reverse transcriptase domain-containing protein n=1 Tax=Periplaneta americana TaxID=6978 RepID=A0ABQ8TYB8_PERAM|nr:hypothetical protein ANN_03148 [Periplaneta americana]
METQLNNTAIENIPTKKQDIIASTSNNMEESDDLSNSPDNVQNIGTLQSSLTPTSTPKNLQHMEDWFTLIAFIIQHRDGSHHELTSEELAEEYGFKLVSGPPNVTVLSFADDIVIVGKDSEAAKHIAEIATRRLHEIGLEINAKKSKCISIVNGKLNSLLFTSIPLQKCPP